MACSIDLRTSNLELDSEYRRETFNNGEFWRRIKMLIDVIGSVTTFEKQMVGALVAADFRTTDVFTQYGIDYCCGGQKTIGQACAELGIHLETLMAMSLNDLFAWSMTTGQMHL